MAMAGASRAARYTFGFGAPARGAAANAKGHATLFRGGDRSAGVFHPLAPAIAKIHRRLKDAFDPSGILNPGRMDNF